MAFFQNLFNQEFRGNWVLGDRQQSLTFSCPANKNTSEYQLAYNDGPWDFSSTGSVLSINYSLDSNFQNYTNLSIDVAGSVVASTTPQEVVDALNNNSTFKSLFTAELAMRGSSVLVKTKTGILIKVWIANTGAERALKFNKNAGVAELPLYFEKHTIENRSNYPDSVGQLIKLDETDTTVDAPIIEAAGFDVSNMKEDWELIRGRSGLFTFKKITVDGSNRTTQVIEYPAGAEPGDLARKINYKYSGSNTNPSEVTEIPYILVSGDLIAP